MSDDQNESKTIYKILEPEKDKTHWKYHPEDGEEFNWPCPMCSFPRGLVTKREHGFSIVCPNCQYGTQSTGAGISWDEICYEWQQKIRVCPRCKQALSPERFTENKQECNDCSFTARQRRPLQSRPRDPNELAKLIVDIAVGEVKDIPKEVTKDRVAVIMGRRGGLVGGKRRAEKLSKERRIEIAKRAAEKRWGKKS